MLDPRKVVVHFCRDLMRNPHRSRNIALGFFVSGCLAILGAFLLPAATANGSLKGMLFIYGATSILFGGGSALFRHFDARAKEAIARGEDIIARWKIDPATWHEFIAIDRQRSRDPGALPNELDAPNEIPVDGVEVIAAKSSVQIGDSIHRLPRRGTPEITAAVLHDGSPAFVELLLYYPGGGHGASGVPRSSTRTALRFPVGRDAWEQAEIVVAHFRGDTPGEADCFHGKGDGTDREDLSKCYYCGYETHRLMSHCPNCGRGLQSKRWSGRFGWTLLACGIFISSLMGFVLYAIAPTILGAGKMSGGLRFSGTPEQGRFVLALLATVEIFGFTAICYGLWQILTGNRNKWVIYFFFALLLLVWALVLSL